MKLLADFKKDRNALSKGAFWNSYGQLLECSENVLSVYDSEGSSESCAKSE